MAWNIEPPKLYGPNPRGRVVMAGLSQRVTTRNARLNGLESITTLMVMAGSLATLITQNIVLAAAPLSLAMIINLHNRRQIDRLTSHYAELRLSTLRRSIQHELLAIQDSLLEHQQRNLASELPQIRHHIAVLSSKVESLTPHRDRSQDAETFTNLFDQVETLKQQAQGCSRTLTLIMQDLHHLSANAKLAPLAGIKSTIHHYQTLASNGASSHPTAISKICQTWSKDIQSLHAQIETLRPAQDFRGEQEVDLSSLYKQIATLKHQLVLLQSRFYEQLHPFAEEQQHLQRSLQQMQQQLHSLHFRNSKVSQSVRPGLPPHTEIEEWMDQALIPLQVQLVSLFNGLDLFEVDVQGLQYHALQLRQLHRQLLGIHQQLKQITARKGVEA